MKYIIAILSFVIFISTQTTIAASAEKLTLQLSPNELAAIANGLTQLDGYFKIVKGQHGEEQSVIIPYDYPNARLTIAHDEAVVFGLIREFQSTTSSLSASEKEKIANVKIPVDLLSITVDDLKANINPFPPSALAAMAPICPSCAGF